MIICIDGYDGTGKTTLAKKLANKYNFTYLERPAVKMVQEKKNCSYEEARSMVQKIEKQLFATGTKAEIASFYLSVFVWLRKYSKEKNIVLDRGLLTTYAVVGFPETEAVFDDFIRKGAFLDGSIYLTADDEVRVKRIFAKNPNDPDLNFPKKWHENNLEEYATERHLNYTKIDTTYLTPDQVFEQADKIFQKFLKNHNLDKGRNY